MSRVVPLPAVNSVVDSTVAVINGDGSVSTPGGVASAVYAAQQVVSATATALASQALVNGLVLRAKETNVGSVFVGTAGVTTTNTGSGNGFALLPGASINLAVSNANAVYIIGTASDVVYVIGN